MVQRRFLQISSVILTIWLLAGICGCTLKSEEYILGHQILEPKTNIVLALFDGSEKRTVHENDMKEFLEEPLEKFGFEMIAYSYACKWKLKSQVQRAAT